VPISNPSQNKKCTESYVHADKKYVDALHKKIKNSYGRCVDFDETFSYFFADNTIWEKHLTISQLNMHFIKLVCNYLEINTKIVETSEGLTSQKKEKGIQEIVLKQGGSVYVNAIGGQDLYSREDFEKNGITLKFIKMNAVDLQKPYSSILDALFTQKKEHLIEQLKKYTLI
jgi:hypothetical protein